METIELPGKTHDAHARLDFLSMRGANQFLNELCDMFPSVGAKFIEYPDQSQTLVLVQVDASGNPIPGTGVALDACTPDGLHRAYYVAELLDTGLPSAARKLGTTYRSYSVASQM